MTPTQRLLGTLVGLAGLGVAPPSQDVPPVFQSQVELVTVDAVVVDQEGKPVPGLSKDDFVLYEDGHPREVTTFEAIDTAAPPTTPIPRSGPATNQVLDRGVGRGVGRAFALVLDDLSTTSREAADARPGVSAFIQRTLRDGDEIALGTTSGSVWWTGFLPACHDDLLAIVGNFKGRAQEPALVLDYESDYEAFRINSGGVGSREQLANVIDRFQRETRCSTYPECKGLAEARAAEVDASRLARTRAILSVVQRSISALAPVRGRKSVLLFSDGFLDDREAGARDVALVAARANAVVYFIGISGLSTGEPSAAERYGPRMPDPQRIGMPVGGIQDSPVDEEALLRRELHESAFGSAGAEDLAEDTGGFAVRRASDIAAAAGRAVAETRVFYLLGFEASPGKQAGEWRRLRVETTRKGVTVRARRGYFFGTKAPQPAPNVAGKHKRGSKEAPSLLPPVAAALDSVENVGDIPLRGMAYVLEPRPKGLTRTLVVAEVEADRPTPENKEKPQATKLEFAVQVAERDGRPSSRSMELVEIAGQRGESAGWRPLAREFELPAGVAQIRLVVRDTATGALGAVTCRVEVPSQDVFRISTPILTERVEGGDNGTRRRPTPTAHREFPPEGTLHVRFEVFGAARPAGGGVPQVDASLEIRSADGRLISQAAPSRIAADADGRLVRVVGIGLSTMTEGAYELRLSARDEVSGKHIEHNEGFVLTQRPAREPSP